MNGRRQRRTALGVVTTAMVATVLAMTVSSAGALEQLDDLLTTTTSVVIDEIVDDVAVAPVDDTTTTSSTTASTSTSTSTSTTTTTSTSTTSTTIAQVTSITEPRATVTDAAERAPVTTTTTTAQPVATVVLEPRPVIGPIVARDVAALTTPHGPRSTLDVLELLRGRGATPQLVARVLAPFPIGGPAHYSDDWGVFRHGPPPHSHQGTDIFAERGTPVLASGDGVLSRVTTTGRLGGTSLRLTTANGSFFYYAHLDRFAVGIANGHRVKTGDVLGFVGNTGNAVGTPPHVHYEIHPRGGAAMPPVPYLDRWLDEARTAARAIVGSPSLGAVVALQPALRPVIAADAGPADPASPEAQRLTMQSIDAQPVSASNSWPVLSVAAPLGVLSYMAHRGKKRARRRIARHS